MKLISMLYKKMLFDVSKPGLVTFLNPYSYLVARRNTEVFNKFDTILADGIVLVIFLHLFRINRSERKSFDMTSLADGVFKYAEHEGKSIYFIGSESEYISKAVDSIRQKYPGLIVKGFRNGYFEDSEERTETIKQIVLTAPDIIVAGMGTPFQEQFLVDVTDAGWHGTGFTCGGFFHQTAKDINYYPKWMDKLQLRWLYRIYDEPKLFKRYAIYYPKFVFVFLYDYICFSLEKRRGESTTARQTPTLAILGTRGIPARHGGFETFAEQLGLYLVSKGWHVIVYCQNNGSESQYEEIWNGIRLIHIPVHGSDTIGSIFFDWKSTVHVLRENSLVLTLGYNTALFSSLYRLTGITNLINMDGFEWRRKKWALPQRAWLYLNERLACLLGNHLIADHPKVKTHLQTRVNSAKISMIPYGVDIVHDADASLLQPYGLEPGSYALVVARPEPENSIVEIVKAFSVRQRGYKLVLVGAFDPGRYSYHVRVEAAAGSEVQFVGAIYNKNVVAALRYHSRLYIHGHQVGGTNPSLLESLAAGAAVLAHDNQFNRWVAGSAACYFQDVASCAAELDRLLPDDRLLHDLGVAGRERCQQEFSSEQVLSDYEKLLHRWWQYS